MYADDTEVHYSDEDLATAQTKLNQVMMNVDHWLTQNRMIVNVNVKKTKAMLIGSRQAVNKADNVEIHLNNETIEQVTSFIGFRTNNVLSWEPRISRLCQRTYF